MTKQELVRRVAEATGVDQKRTNLVLDSLVVLLRQSLEAGDQIRLPGLGTFKTVLRAPRHARNPRTGEPMVVPATRRVRFIVSSDLKQAVASSAGQ